MPLRLNRQVCRLRLELARSEDYNRNDNEIGKQHSTFPAQREFANTEADKQRDQAD